MKYQLEIETDVATETGEDTREHSFKAIAAIMLSAALRELTSIYTPSFLKGKVRHGVAVTPTLPELHTGETILLQAETDTEYGLQLSVTSVSPILELRYEIVEDGKILAINEREDAQELGDRLTKLLEFFYGKDKVLVTDLWDDTLEEVVPEPVVPAAPAPFVRLAIEVGDRVKNTFQHSRNAEVIGTVEDVDHSHVWIRYLHYDKGVGLPGKHRYHREEVILVSRPEKTPEAPKADAPKADAPKADAPKADAPKVDVPVLSGGVVIEVGDRVFNSNMGSENKAALGTVVSVTDAHIYINYAAGSDNRIGKSGTYAYPKGEVYLVSKAEKTPEAPKAEATTESTPSLPRPRHLRVGDKVKRGKEWHYGGYQDGEGKAVGTVTKVLTSQTYYVEWSHGHKNSYTYSPDGRQELLLIKESPPWSMPEGYHVPKDMQEVIAWFKAGNTNCYVRKGPGDSPQSAKGVSLTSGTPQELIVEVLEEGAYPVNKGGCVGTPEEHKIRSHSLVAIKDPKVAAPKPEEPKAEAPKVYEWVLPPGYFKPKDYEEVRAWFFTQHEGSREVHFRDSTGILRQGTVLEFATCNRDVVDCVKIRPSYGPGDNWATVDHRDGWSTLLALKDVPIEAPKAEAPKAEAPKAETPEVEASKIEAPKEVEGWVMPEGFIAVTSKEALKAAFDAGARKIYGKDFPTSAVTGYILESYREYPGAPQDRWSPGHYRLVDHSLVWSYSSKVRDSWRILAVEVPPVKVEPVLTPMAVEDIKKLMSATTDSKGDFTSNIQSVTVGRIAEKDVVQGRAYLAVINGGSNALLYLRYPHPPYPPHPIGNIPVSNIHRLEIVS